MSSLLKSKCHNNNCLECLNHLANEKRPSCCIPNYKLIIPDSIKNSWNIDLKKDVINTDIPYGLKLNLFLQTLNNGFVPWTDTDEWFLYSEGNEYKPSIWLSDLKFNFVTYLVNSFKKYPPVRIFWTVKDDLVTVELVQINVKNYKKMVNIFGFKCLIVYLLEFECRY